ncbi:hypothetical protein MKK63_10225 [Methylobacterium sp. J-088]|uniref:hypothetical protein n=2 Tax=unclassified Methylobacterium TaxID=2615210 RepID=UPI001FBB0358|nr:hypothetical protein [Methylobacterium sp. J-088]MCJ2063085.1 hypothetical protein [Methylobacterium sp. J-088]
MPESLMIAALFALAAAMIIGGCAAVIQGFPYVRLESGLAMVIAGSVAASSGAVLLGLGVLAVSFRRVARAIEQVPTSGPRQVSPEAALLASPGAAPNTADEGRARLPILPAAPAFIVPSVVEPPFDPERPRIEPNLDLRPEAASPVPADLPKPVRSEPTLYTPVPPIVPRGPIPPSQPETPRSEAVQSVGVQPAGVIAPEDDLFAAPESLLGPGAGPPAHLTPEPEPKPSAPQPDTRTVVGRYASGGNTYVMFENGSIEAETPQGRFTFASLDELKAFVDGGGESGTRGAA